MIYLPEQSTNRREVIQNIFSPLVGVISSSIATEACQRNNLTFAELLQPFSKLQNDAHFRDVSGTSVSIRGLRLNFCDINWHPPQMTHAKKMLNEAVGNYFSEQTQVIKIGNVELEVPTAEPWFERWREIFLSVQATSDHEFTRHLLGYLVILSSSDGNIIDTAQKLTQNIQQMQNVASQKFAKWFYPNNVLVSYVVLHESLSEGDISNAQQAYELIKSTYGNNKCFLLQLNSLNGTSVQECDVTDYWKLYLKKNRKIDSTPTETMGGSKSPQDAPSSIISMPIIQTAHNYTEGIMESEKDLLHPLSPLQETAVEVMNSSLLNTETLGLDNTNTDNWIGAGAADIDIPHGQCLNSSDIENIRYFIQDYAVRALIPYVEQLVVILSEAVTNKKGVSKSLLSATKRWFVTNKPASSSTSSQNAVIYTQESSELQTRKLGDLYFMFGHYNLAFQAYHQAKRDFNADSAWQYYAGALEMAAISAFMVGTANRKTYDYMEDAIVCYLTVCRLPQFATRATLLSSECLKAANLYYDAAKQLIRMTSEDSDLRSALLLEQASYCFLYTHPPMHRKYAFHILLAGNRYSRAGHRRHAYRCYKQAYQIFKNCGWSLAEDHIQYTMAKQAFLLKKLDEACLSLAYLLRASSQQSPQQQVNFLKEYIHTKNELQKQEPSLGLQEHAIPKIAQRSIRILAFPRINITNPLYVPASSIEINNTSLIDEDAWHKLEEVVVTVATANRPLVFKPVCNLFTQKNINSANAIAVQGEQIEISVELCNTMRCDIKLTNVGILWQLKLESGEALTNLDLYNNTSLSDFNSNDTAINAAVKGNLQTLVIEALAEKTINFQIIPKLTGTLTIIGIVCNVALHAEPTINLLGKLNFEVEKAKPHEKHEFSLNVLPQLPALSVGFSAVPTNILAGEVVPLNISLHNSGVLPIEDIYISCESPRWVTLLTKDNNDTPFEIQIPKRETSSKKISKEKEINHIVFRLHKQNATNTLEGQESTIIPMRIQAPYDKHQFSMRLLVYYSMPKGSSHKIKYRVVRHKWRFNIRECLHSKAVCIVSNSITGELGLNVDVSNAAALGDRNNAATKTELYVDALSLHSQQYKLHNDKLYILNQLETIQGSLGNACLMPTKATSFQCRLRQVDATIEHSNKLSTTERPNFSYQYLDNKIPAQSSEKEVSSVINEMYAFLQKHETSYEMKLDAGSVAVASLAHFDETNMTQSKPSTTLGISWSAFLIENSIERKAYGYHFIRLSNIFEVGCCPETIAQALPPTTIKLLNDDPKDINYSIEEFPQLFASKQFNSKMFGKANTNEMDYHMNVGDDWNDDEENWEKNDNFVDKRCLIEDEVFNLLTKH